MFKRYLLPAALIMAMSSPAFAQRKERQSELPPTTQSLSSFRELFKPAVEKASRSIVRILVDGKEAALGTVVSSEGYILTKASEVKAGRVSVKTRDGRDFEAKLTSTSEVYDLAVLKVEGTGLTAIEWSSSEVAPVGNWLAIPGVSEIPVAVGVVSTKPRSPTGPYGPQRVPNEKSGFLGVQILQDIDRATIELVTPDSAAAKAGIKPKDIILRVDKNDIVNGDALIQTLAGYKAGDVVDIHLERDGKPMDLKATLGKRPADPTAPKGKGGLRFDQNQMGSTLSERRTGFPRFFQTDAVVKPIDCGGPLVDLEGRVVGLTIARAGRTESHAIPAETVKELLPVLLAAKAGATPTERVEAARKSLKAAEDAKAAITVIAEGKRMLNTAIAEEKWWKDHPLEQGPTPRTVPQ